MKKYYDIKKAIKEKNLLPKAVSLLLAIILWGYVSKENISEVSIKSAVTFTGLDDNYVVSAVSAKIITAKISGHKDEIKGIGSRNIRLAVDLSNAEPGDYKKYPVECHKIDFSGNYEVVLHPANVEVLVEKKITRKVKVIPEFKGTAKSGFMLGHASIIPEYIKIDGPSSIINNIGIIYTENIIIDNKSETFSKDIKIRKVHEDNVNYNISRVNITVPVIDYAETEVIEVPILIKNKNRNFDYLLIFDTVKIIIIKNDSQELVANSLSAYIDCDEIKIDNEEFVSKSKITAIGFVHVIADSLKIGNRILSSTPAAVEIIITKK